MKHRRKTTRKKAHKAKVKRAHKVKRAPRARVAPSKLRREISSLTKLIHALERKVTTLTVAELRHLHSLKARMRRFPGVGDGGDLGDDPIGNRAGSGGSDFFRD